MGFTLPEAVIAGKSDNPNDKPSTIASPVGLVVERVDRRLFRIIGSLQVPGFESEMGVDKCSAQCALSHRGNDSVAMLKSQISQSSELRVTIGTDLPTFRLRLWYVPMLPVDRLEDHGCLIIASFASCDPEIGSRKEVAPGRTASYQHLCSFRAKARSFGITS